MRIALYIMTLILIFINLNDSYAQDVKTATQIGKNAAVAEANEILYHDEMKKTLKNRAALALKVTTRNIMKINERNSKRVVDELREEGEAYKRISIETRWLLNAGEDFLIEAKKHPLQLWVARKCIAKIFAEGSGLVGQAVNIAMGGKVRNPFENNGKTQKGDGHNLLSQDERIEICNNTINGLRRLRKATVAATFRLRCEHTWAELFGEKMGYEVYWAKEMDRNIIKTKSLIGKNW